MAADARTNKTVEDVTLDSILATLERFNPNPDVLLSWLASRVSDAMLEQIAAADHGHKKAEYLNALRKIRASSAALPALGALQEVLELTRWSTAAEQAKNPQDRLQAHLCIAFACAVLLRAGVANERNFDGENQTVAKLVDSVLTFEEEAQSATLAFLSWRVIAGKKKIDAERPFVALGVLLLALALHQCRQDDGQYLADLCEWVVKEEAWTRQHELAENQNWLFGLTYFNSCHTLWQSLGRTLLVSPTRAHPAQANAALTELGVRLGNSLV